MGHMRRRKRIRMVIGGKVRTTTYVPHIYTPVFTVGLANKE